MASILSKQDIVKGLRMLEIFKSDKKKVHANILKKISSTEEYFRVIYQVCGYFFQEKIVQEILSCIKNNEIGWQGKEFTEIRTKLEEYDDYTANPFEVVEGVIKCPKCGSRKTWSVQKQTRGCDEPMTTISKCAADGCGKEWSYSG